MEIHNLIQHAAKIQRKAIIAVAALCFALCCGCTAASGSPASASTTPTGASADPEEVSDILDGAVFLALLGAEQGAVGTDATARYQVLELTGVSLPTKQIFSCAELESLFSMALEEDALSSLAASVSWSEGGETHTASGLELSAFLKLCGADLSADDCPLQITTAEGAVVTVTSGIRPALIALVIDGAVAENGPALFLGGDTPCLLCPVKQILLDIEYGDPHYEMHNRPPHDKSADIPFTLRIFEGDTLRQSLTFTTAQLEEWAIANPMAVSGGYYGTIADLDSIRSMGGGGFLDYYEGLRLDWLLNEQAGITDWKGSDVLYGRNGSAYAEIMDISYFTQENYYICTPEGQAVYGTVPILAYSKNGAPLLPDHEHESAGYIRYNTLHSALEELGMEVDLGIVKNHSGPFAVCLGNCPGYYGGYQQETAGDCIQIALYLA